MLSVLTLLAATHILKNFTKSLKNRTLDIYEKTEYMEYNMIDQQHLERMIGKSSLIFKWADKF